MSPTCAAQRLLCRKKSRRVQGVPVAVIVARPGLRSGVVPWNPSRVWNPPMRPRQWRRSETPSTREGSRGELAFHHIVVNDGTSFTAPLPEPGAFLRTADVMRLNSPSGRVCAMPSEEEIASVQVIGDRSKWCARVH